MAKQNTNIDSGISNAIGAGDASALKALGQINPGLFQQMQKARKKIKRQANIAPTKESDPMPKMKMGEKAMAAPKPNKMSKATAAISPMSQALGKY